MSRFSQQLRGSVGVQQQSVKETNHRNSTGSVSFICCAREAAAASVFLIVRPWSFHFYSGMKSRLDFYSFIWSWFVSVLVGSRSVCRGVSDGRKDEAQIRWKYYFWIFRRFTIFLFIPLTISSSRPCCGIILLHIWRTGSESALYICGI